MMGPENSSHQIESNLLFLGMDFLTSFHAEMSKLMAGTTDLMGLIGYNYVSPKNTQIFF